MKNDIGSKIRELRKLAGMSQMRLADKIGVSYQQVQKYEKGASKLSVPRLMQIADVFGVPPESFLYGDSYDPKKIKNPSQNVLEEEEMAMLILLRRLGRKSLKLAFNDLLKGMVNIVEGK